MMKHDFNCMATGIGSMPMLDPEQAVRLSLAYLFEAPLWPQLPRRGFYEHMDAQYSESLPGLVVDEEKAKVFFDTSKDLSPELEKFYERYIANDYGYFKISEKFAAAFPVFVRLLKNGLPANMRYVKGQITGPLTAGLSFKDETGRDIIHNETLFDAVVKGLAMKAAWQIEELKGFGKPVIIFIDEPVMETLGSGYSAVSSEIVAEKLNEIIDTIHGLGGMAGTHCCGNADWSMIFRTRVDIVNFDAFGYMDRVLLYMGDIKKFYSRGGALAWGIVPTGMVAQDPTADMLVSRLEEGMMRLEREGVDRATILGQCLITPSCGMGSLTPDESVTVLKLLREVSDRMQKMM
ncbi:MAG: methionine synthase [Deltaproteobacteria bacterium]|nr:methionine synthase [Deltaproteobacteria bacterium]